MVRAQLDNPDGILRPGMFVKARVSGAMLPNTLLVPQKSVQETSNGHVVYVVSQEGKAEIRPVMVGKWVGEDWIITQGLKAGEQVVTDGFQRLAPGAPVKVVSAIPATDTEAPTAPAGK